MPAEHLSGRQPGALAEPARSGGRERPGSRDAESRPPVGARVVGGARQLDSLAAEPFVAEGPSSASARGATVIGVGAIGAGDDEVGFAVINGLRSLVPASIRLVCVPEPSGLIPLLEGEARVVIVDAAVDAGPPGTIRCEMADRLGFAALDRTSTHGFGVGGVLQLAEAMGLARLDQVCIVAIAIERPQCPRFGLSPPVSAAVGEAVRTVLRIIGGVATGVAAAAGSQ